MVQSSELLEKFEWVKEEDSFVHVDTHRQEVQDEAADVLMVLLLFCNAAKIDITSAVMHKLQEVKAKIQSKKQKASTSNIISCSVILIVGTIFFL